MGQAPSWGLAFRRLFGVGGSDGGPAGAAGARSAHTARAGAFGPRPCGGFAGLGPAKRRRPGVAARPSCAPRHPPILPMDAGWGWGRRAPWGTRRGGGVWRPGAARRAAPGLPNKRARPGPLAPGALFQGASRPAAAPRALGFCTAAPAGKAGRGARAFCRPWNGGCRARA